MSIRKTILSSILGAAAGALSGAALLGIPTYLSNETGFFGPERKLAPLAAAMGFALGIIPGTVIGFVVGFFRMQVVIGVLVGLSVGFICLLILFGMGMDPNLDQGVFLFGLACMPIGGFIGLLVAQINRRPLPAPPSEPLNRSEGHIFPSLTE